MSKHSFLPFLFLGIGWTVMVTILLCLPGSAFPTEDWFNKYYVDKFVHAFLFGVLVSWYVWAIQKSDMHLADKKQFALFICICACLFGLAMEFVQKYYIPNRAFEMLDFAADSAGAIVAYLLLRQKLSKA